MSAPWPPLLVATKNPDKFSELRRLWDTVLPPLVLAGSEYPAVEEPYDTYEANALAKARTLSDLTGRPVISDDSGLEVEALGGMPGVRSSRTPSPSSTWQERNAYILRRLAALGETSRRAVFICVCALVAPGIDPIVARGEASGFIAAEPRGAAGFGYDPIFVYPAYCRTFGEVGVAMKDAVSHRGNAVRALIAQARAQLPRDLFRQER